MEDDSILVYKDYKVEIAQNGENTHDREIQYGVKESGGTLPLAEETHDAEDEFQENNDDKIRYTIGDSQPRIKYILLHV